METITTTTLPQEGLVKIIKSAFNSRLLTLAYDNLKPECLVPERFLKEACKSLRPAVDSFLKKHFAFKYNIVLYATYAKLNLKDLENTVVELKHFQTDIKYVFDIKSYDELFAQNIENIIRQTEEFPGNGGSWTLVQLIKMELNLQRYQPLKGSSYIPLPLKIHLKKACINVKNNDVYCFKWAILAALAEVRKDACYTSKYKVHNISSDIIRIKNYSLNFKGLSFPLKLNDISIFEENNRDISVNVFCYDEENQKIVGPYYKRRARKAKHINLLFIEERNGEESNSHYAWIKNMSRLLRNQKTAFEGKIFVCDDCLQHFHKKDKLEEHINNDCQSIVNIPKRDKSILEFKNCDKTLDVPFVIYANSSYIYEKSEIENTSKPYAFCYYIKCNFNQNLDKLCCFKAPNATAEFIKSLIKDVNYFYCNFLTKLKPVKNQNLCVSEQLDFLENNKCHICSDEINKEDKVKSYCHTTGKYRGPAHYFCIVNFKLLNFFPVIFKNFSKHDYQLFAKELYSFDNEAANITAQYNDSYISLAKTINTDIGAKIEIRLLDSSRFMPNKLADLVKTMKIKDFKIIKSMFPNDENKFNLLIRNAIFPYNYLNSMEKLSDTCLPGREEFYNHLSEKECSLEDYKHAHDIWSTFKCKTLQDYLVMYLKSNVILLADVFENFRGVCKSSYSLDPCHYYTAEELSWDAMLKITKIKFPLITDKTKLTFLQKGLRGDVAVCAKRHAIANNKYLDDYNDQMPAKYLIQFKDNSWYEWAMSQVLPQSDFEWLTVNENFSLDSLTNDHKYGYILEVELKYPQEVHDLHNSLPFCSEKKALNDSKEEKLFADLNHKYNYVIYYKNLQQCLKHGLKLERIHKILKFKQTNWLKSYITLNSNGKTCFEKHVFKLLTNALYNKIIEKRYKDTIIKFVNKWESEGKKMGIRAYIAKPEFKNVHIFGENLVAVELDNTYSYYNSIYLEFILLELFKWKMYNFHYDCMMPKYNKNLELNYIDANVFIYTITIKDIYNDLCLLKNFKINGKAILKEFIGLRSKMYSLKIIKNFNNNKNINCLSNLKYCFLNKTLNNLPISVFNSKLHNLYIELLKDKYSRYLDNKRIMYLDNIHTLAKGYSH
ncbi:uncharacterized protein LOC124419759 [Lucilia cuprina]|uniref:uncharacterized protein LOC124419759 n=1 Tax=Lucilia cuprina TaxID=7375 RepID=UPI001F068CC0|nr:uncharacterized protein LOC124419759 [Lucilia cuprina]